MKVTFFCGFLILTTSLTSIAHAVLIASDSFATSGGVVAYTPLTSILGQNPNYGSFGFVGPWGNCCTSAMVAVPGGLTHPLTPGNTYPGQLISATFDSSATRNLSRQMNYTPTSGTYYMSMLFNKSTVTYRGDLLAGVSPSQNPEANIFQVNGAYIGFVDGGISFFSGPGAFITEILNVGDMHVGETYFTLMQYDFTTSGPDTVTITIYDGSSVQRATQTFSGLNLDLSMGRFSVLTQDFGPIPVLDEMRFGTNLADVMVQPRVLGDFDGDGDVDGRDFLIWQRGASPNPLSAGDLTEWQANYNMPMASTARIAIPEPSGVLLLMGLAALTSLRRK